MNTKKCLAANLAILLLSLGFSVNAEDSRQQIALKTIGTSTYYVDGYIEGYGDAPLLVDTGSGYSTISESTLTRLRQTGDAVYLKKLEGIMANGSKMIVPVYRISGLVLSGKCTIPDVEVAVFPSGTRQILGLSALRKVTPFTFSIDPPSLMLSNCHPNSVRAKSRIDVKDNI